MNAKVLITNLLLLMTLSVFSSSRNADLQIDLYENSTYLIYISNESFRAQGQLLVHQITSGFHPVRIYRYTGKKRQLLYRGGINLAPQATTYAALSRNDLQVTAVVPHSNPTNNPVVWAMDSASFYHFLTALDQEWFESGKMELLEMSLQKHYFTSQQISELIEKLSFDSSKLQFAKLAYSNTVDPENYFWVRDKLSFSSSKTELTRYIAQF
ncbi:MAG TPA: DUF4476 domain-containing protein [Flavobacteriaceae bacterium]|jgi:hypothetical protein|nr:DUF4476 domain-containing protein [Flavobacteriaceae bacterium]